LLLARLAGWQVGKLAGGRGVLEGNWAWQCHLHMPQSLIAALAIFGNIR